MWIEEKLWLDIDSGIDVYQDDKKEDLLPAIKEIHCIWNKKFRRDALESLPISIVLYGNWRTVHIFFHIG
jgi:hypothetical protein